jgi:hypothetical protein
MVGWSIYRSKRRRARPAAGRRPGGAKAGPARMCDSFRGVCDHEERMQMTRPLMKGAATRTAPEDDFVVCWNRKDLFAP